jgi:DNA mismatch repair protein MutS
MFKPTTIINTLAFACLLTAGQGYSNDQAPEISLNDHICHQYLTATFGEEKPAVDSSANENIGFIEKLKQSFNTQLDPKTKTLSPRQAQKITFNFNNQLPETSTEKIIDKSCIDKLEIVGGGENHKLHLLNNIFGGIYTMTGKARAALTLCQPTTNIQILRARQQGIAYISKRHQFIDQASNHLDIIKDHESKTYTFFDDKPPVNPEILKMFYFNLLSKLNTNTAVLETYNRLFGAGVTAFGLAYAPVMMTHITAEQENVSYWTAAKIVSKGIYNFVLSSEVHPAVKAAVAIPVALQGIAAYAAYNTLKTTGAVANHLQDILISTATHMNELRKLSSLVSKNKQLLNQLPSLQALADFNDSSKHSAQLNKLLGMLDTNTFIGEPSFWSVTGRVFAAYELMRQVKDELVPVFVAAGELDMYVSLAKLYNAHQEKDAHYCMVNFIQNSATPIIDARNFWNPFINADAVILNNMTFDPTCPNSVLTGPNTGGKSTVIKGIMINVLMAQTFGIAPSQSLTITPFAKLNCFMNISDDIATGASLFKSEVARAKKLLDMVQNLESNEFSFVIIDEVFTGTSPQEGEMAALRFAQKLGSYSNNVGIIATHYPKMTELEKGTNGMFRNHHVEILRNDDGSLNRTFKLKNGPSFFNVAFDILEEEGLFV